MYIVQVHVLQGIWYKFKYKYKQVQILVRRQHIHKSGWGPNNFSLLVSSVCSGSVGGHRL